MRGNKCIFIILAIALVACSHSANPNKQIPEFLLRFPAGSFAYPVSNAEYVTEKNDWRDDWYNAQDFGENRHLGEDWNKKTGGNTDCGEQVYAIAEGEIVFAGDAGPGWGNVVIIEHRAEDGTTLQSLYGHLQSIGRSTGHVERREPIGTIGNASGRYACHLHLELRWRDCPMWNQAGPGYSDNRNGWIDPSEFIEQSR